MFASCSTRFFQIVDHLGICRTITPLCLIVLHSQVVADSYWYMDPMPAVRVVP